MGFWRRNKNNDTSWKIADLQKMEEGLKNCEDLFVRHKLFAVLIESFFDLRKNPHYRTQCAVYAMMHIEEFDKLKEYHDQRGLTFVFDTFKYLLNIHAEDKNYLEGITLCRSALNHPLDQKQHEYLRDRLTVLCAKQNSGGKQAA